MGEQAGRRVHDNIREGKGFAGLLARDNPVEERSGFKQAGLLAREKREKDVEQAGLLDPDNT